MTRSNFLSDDMIQIQRQLLAQRLLRAKGFPEFRPTQHSEMLPMRQASALAQEVCSTQHVQKQPKKPAFKNWFQCDDDDQSMSTATLGTYQDSLQPLHLPTFKPAAGAYLAPQYLVWAFVARLRAGVTVKKHSRNRFKKSALYTLKLERDGETLTWTASNSDPDVKNNFNSTSRSKKPEYRLSECCEVRLAGQIDPLSPAYAGSATLREKCDNFDAHKSFSLVYPHRTLDFTAITDDQKTMLVEGFSALCYHLHLQKNAQQQHESVQYKLDHNKATRSCIRFGSRNS